ncbi:MAG: hypothetical protein AB2699_03025, partial [Candidatus Thiodiazotropha taylori]
AIRFDGFSMFQPQPDHFCLGVERTLQPQATHLAGSPAQKIVACITSSTGETGARPYDVRHKLLMI